MDAWMDGWGSAGGRQLQAGLSPWLCLSLPSSPGSFQENWPRALTPGPSIRCTISCCVSSRKKYPVGRALNGSRKGKDKELVSFLSPRWATFASLTGRGCNSSIGEVIYRNVANYRNLLCKKAGKGPQAALVGSGAWEGSRAGGQNLLFPGKLLALPEFPVQRIGNWNGAALPWREEREEGTRRGCQSQPPADSSTPWHRNGSKQHHFLTWIGFQL